MIQFPPHPRSAVQKSKSIKELLAGDSGKLAALKARSQRRSATLNHVCAALPPELAERVASAGLDGGQLTVGVTGGAWAARLRYFTDTLRTKVGDSMEIEIHSVRIKVVPPRTQRR